MSSTSQRADAINKAIPIVIAAVQRPNQFLVIDGDAGKAGADLGDAVVALARKIEAYVEGG